MHASQEVESFEPLRGEAVTVRERCQPSFGPSDVAERSLA